MSYKYLKKNVRPQAGVTLLEMILVLAHYRHVSDDLCKL